MSRKSRDQRGQFRTMVRYDGRGRIIPGGNILKKGQKPQEGRWQAKEAYECCTAPAPSDALIDARILAPKAWRSSHPGPDERWILTLEGRNEEWAGTLIEQKEDGVGGFIELGRSLYKIIPDETIFIVTLANSINSDVIGETTTEFKYELSGFDGTMGVSTDDTFVYLYVEIL
jgi:hypothetical protein